MTDDHRPWTERLRAVDVAPWLERAISAGWLTGERGPSLLFHDLDGLRARVGTLRARFGERTLHAIAIKANPLLRVLEAVVEAGGGLEAASIEEVTLAVAAGCPPSHIVYDSPAKTHADLVRAFDLGVHLNADNFDELARIDTLSGRLGEATVGVRINPAVGDGRIATTSTGGKRSRFGILMPEDEAGIDALAARLAAFGWLTSLHVHVGSQGCDLTTLVPACARALTLARAIDAAAGERRIDTIDIGGGLPTRYREDDPIITPAQYVEALEEAAPALMTDYALITEFGRSVQAPCGFAATRVEYVKDLVGETMVVGHLGADFALRPAYRAEDWWLDVTVYDKDGKPKVATDLRPTHVAGPLCFSGDFLARGRMLPEIVPGDILVFHDTGAYTLSMWSRHCSRGIPTVVGMEGCALRVLRAREAPEDMVTFWS